MTSSGIHAVVVPNNTQVWTSPHSSQLKAVQSGVLQQVPTWATSSLNNPKTGFLAAESSLFFLHWGALDGRVLEEVISIHYSFLNVGFIGGHTASKWVVNLVKKHSPTSMIYGFTSCIFCLRLFIIFGPSLKKQIMIFFFLIKFLFGFRDVIEEDIHCRSSQSEWLQMFYNPLFCDLWKISCHHVQLLAPMFDYRCFIYSNW